VLSLPVVGLLATGIVASGLIDIFPAFVRFALVFAIVSYLPGVVLQRWLGLNTDSVSVRLARDVLLGLSLFAVIGWCCQLLGASFSTYLVVALLAAFVLFGAFLFVQRVSGGKARAAESNLPRSFLVLAIAVAIGGYFYAVPPVFEDHDDGYDNVGYTRAILVDDDLMPAGVLARALPSDSEPGADPQRGFFHPVMALVSRLAGIDPVTAWHWSCVFLAPVAVLAFYVFARLLLPGLFYPLVAVVLFAMFQTGFGPDYLATTGFGAHLALVFLWVLFLTVAEYCRRPQGGALVAICLLLVGGSLVHVVTMVHFGVMYMSLLLFGKFFSFDFRSLIRIGVASVVCALVVLVWRVSVSAPLDGGFGAHEHLLFFFETGDSFFIPSPRAIAENNGLLALIGIALIPGLLFVRRHRRFALMSLVLALPAILIALNPWVVPRIYTGDAWFANAILLNVPAWIIITLVVGSLIGWARRGTLWRKLIGFALLLICAQLMMTGVREWMSSVRVARAERKATYRDQGLRDLIEFIDAHVAAGSVVLSDPSTSYAISAHCDVKVVVLPGGRGSVGAGDRVARAKAVGNALSEHTTPIEAARVIESFGVDYVILDGSGEPRPTWFGDWDPQALGTLKMKLGSMSGALEVVYEATGYVVYEVGASLPSKFSWFPNLPFSNPPPAALRPCENGAGSGAPRVTGASIFPEEALAGEEVELSISYRRDNEPPSGLPLVLLLRFEQIDYFGSRRPYPGDRYVRLLGERRGGRVRFDMLHMPFGGFFTPDMWPIGRDSYETVPIRLPRDLREGHYAVQIEIGYGEWSSNVAARDLLYNEDSHGGYRCADVRVRHFLTR
jgi:hypothetical protein